MYKQIIPATDWYYVEYQDKQDSLVVFPLAAWALTEEDNYIIGLISISHSQQDDKENKMPRLVSVPPTGGGLYKHKDELNEAELKAFASHKNGQKKKIGFLNNI
ncbi:Uncharacterised protein [Legionella busanensis]|uniref:Uncharacterized protein n=1 Tax=Legionella busanensis TaxID=190655 RepID=A0A378JML4_9GAMM|nr:methionyl-tRNA formyltransferase [Legionella busanensis]STX52474.1 Uncharacterised protein [Legionella busanensis]